MSIILSKIDNIFELSIKNSLKEKKFFYESNLTLIYFDKYFGIKNELSSNEFKEVKDFIEKNEKINNNYLFILTYNFNGDSEVLNYLEQKFNFEFLRYAYIDLIFYSVINLNSYYKYENILKQIKNEFEIVIDIKYNIEYRQLENEISNLELKISKFKNNLKEYSLQDLEKQNKLLKEKFNNLNLFIDEVNKMYILIHKIINQNNEFYKNDFNKIERFNNQNLNDIEEKQFYLINLLKKIELNENKQIKKINELNNINKIIDNKNSILLKQNNEYENKKRDIKNYELTKKKYDNEIIELHNEIKYLKEEKIQRLKLLKESDRLIRKNKEKNIGIFVHIFNVDLYDEIEGYIKNIKNFGFEFDLIINISVNNNNDLKKDKYQKIIEKINKLELNTCEMLHLTYSDNRGMDIGGFFKSYINILGKGINYKYILKLHTKTNNNWRFAMFYSLIGNEKIIKNNLLLLQNGKIGMIGNELIELKNNYANFNSYKFIGIYLKRFNVKYTGKGHFIPGTCFWIKGEILEKYFNIENLTTCYNEFEKDYCGSKINNREGKPHAFERFFGLLVENCNMETVRFDYSN
jgi:hypothetical protein